jgi:hypothetical protein
MIDTKDWVAQLSPAGKAMLDKIEAELSFTDQCLLGSIFTAQEDNMMEYHLDEFNFQHYGDEDED